MRKMYRSGRLVCHGVDKGLKAVLRDRRNGKTHLLDRVGIVAQLERIRRHGVPVVEVVELDVDPVGELERLPIPQQFRIVRQLDFVLAQVLDVLFDGDFEILAQDDELGRLVEPLVVPVRMLRPEHVADPIVLPQPNGRHDVQSGLDGEERVAQGDPLVFRHVRRIDHVDGRTDVAEQRRKFFAVHQADLHFALAEGSEGVLRGLVQSVNVRHIDSVVAEGESGAAAFIRPEELVVVVLGVVREEQVGPVRLADEFLAPEEALGQDIHVGQLLLAGHSHRRRAVERNGWEGPGVVGRVKMGLGGDVLVARVVRRWRVHRIAPA